MAVNNLFSILNEAATEQMLLNALQKRQEKLLFCKLHVSTQRSLHQRLILHQSRLDSLLKSLADTSSEAESLLKDYQQFLNKQQLSYQDSEDRQVTEKLLAQIETELHYTEQAFFSWTTDVDTAEALIPAMKKV
jgi:ABC-type transporter Mla subunit MlaD